MMNIEEISNLGGLVISFLDPLYVASSSTIKSVNFNTPLDTLISNFAGCFCYREALISTKKGIRYVR